MSSLPIYLRHPLLALCFLFLIACSDSDNPAVDQAVNQPPIASLNVYKSRTCQCCEKWVDHIEQAGFEIKTHHPADLNKVKNDVGIAPQFQSCHTAVTTEGYVFEGHIPARFIRQFLKNPPIDAIGLSVPGMPAGSPGMEMGDRFSPYKIWLIKKDGSTAVFASVDSLNQQ